jgi:hypothetical protein
VAERKDAHRISVGKSEGKIPFGKYGREWEDEITIDLLETE